jgi:hypothetical protein
MVGVSRGRRRNHTRKRKQMSQEEIAAKKESGSFQDEIALLRKDPLDEKHYRAATQTLSAESSSTPATSVVSFTYCSPGFLPATALNSSR